MPARVQPQSDLIHTTLGTCARQKCQPLRKDLKRIIFFEPRAGSRFHVFSHARIPRVGLLQLASIARSLGFETSVIIEEMLDPSVPETDILAHLMSGDLICISTITQTVDRCFAWCDRIRSVADTPILVGGTHVTCYPEQALEHATWVLRGEADESFPHFLRGYESNELAKVPGLSFKIDEHVVHNPLPRRPSAAVLNANPHPDYGLIWRKDPHCRIVTVSTARACPFQCTFCYKFHGSKLRCLSPEHAADVVEELWHKHHPSHIFFANDIFHICPKDPTRAKELLELIIRRGIRPVAGFSAQMRCSSARDEEFLKLLQRCGFDRVMVGAESVNPEALVRCQKHQEFEEIGEAMDKFLEHNVGVHGMFILFPGDPDSVLEETLAFAQRHRLAALQILLLTPLPGSRDWEKAGYDEHRGSLLTDHWPDERSRWSKFTGHHCVLPMDHMTPERATRGPLEIMKRFLQWKLSQPGLTRNRFDRYWATASLRWIEDWFNDAENQRYLRFLADLSDPVVSSA